MRRANAGGRSWRGTRDSPAAARKRGTKSSMPMNRMRLLRHGLLERTATCRSWHRARVIFPLSRELLCPRALSRRGAHRRSIAMRQAMPCVASRPAPRPNHGDSRRRAHSAAALRGRTRQRARRNLAIAAGYPAAGKRARALTPDKGQAILIRALALIARADSRSVNCCSPGKALSRSKLDSTRERAPA